MSSLPTPNYVTTEDYQFSVPGNIWDQKTLLAGTFVRPIELNYLPTHVLENDGHKWFNPEKEIYVYCSFGIIIIPKHIIRKA